MCFYCGEQGNFKIPLFTTNILFTYYIVQYQKLPQSCQYLPMSLA